MSPAHRPARGWASHLTRAAVALALAALVACGLWFAALTARGGHLFMVQTPSMARTAPVGTLVVTEPVPASQLRVGDVVSFRPPGVDRVYTHRIVEVTPKGLRTKGDLNSAADGWTVPTDRVVGRAVHLWFGLGWLVKLLPWVMGGLLSTALLARFLRPGRRAPAWIAGSSLSLSVALMMVRPLVRAETTGFVPVGRDGVRMSVVGTGLFPIRATSLDKHQVTVVPGQLGWVETHQTDSHGHFEVIPRMHLPWWGWVLVTLFCLLPLVASLLVGARGAGDDTPPTPDPEEPGSSATGATAVPVADPDRGAAQVGLGILGRWGSRLGTRARGLAAVLSSLVLAVGLTPTQAAFTAQVANSTDTVATRTFYTCLDAMQFYASDGTGSNGTGTHNGELYAGYTMGDGTGVSGTTDQQPSTKLGSGSPYTAYSGNVTQTTNVGCLSDWTSRQQEAMSFNGSTSTFDLPAGSSTSYLTSDPGNADNMTWNIWMRTTSTTGGVLSCPGGTSSDCGGRTTWLNNSGQVCFGVASTVLCTSGKYNDGAWHMVTTQLGSQGMVIWVDAVQQATNTSVTKGSSTVVYMYPQWGYSTKALPSAFSAQAPTDLFFTGDLQMAAVFGRSAGGTQLKQADITAIYQSAMP